MINFKNFAEAQEENGMVNEANVKAEEIVNAQEENEMVNEANVKTEEIVNAQEENEMVEFETIVLNKRREAREMNLRNKDKDTIYIVYVDEKTKECSICEKYIKRTFEEIVNDMCNKALEMSTRNKKEYSVFVNSETEDCFIKEGCMPSSVSSNGHFSYYDGYWALNFEGKYDPKLEADIPRDILYNFIDFLIECVTEAEFEQINTIIQDETYDCSKGFDYINYLAEKYPDAYKLFVEGEIKNRISLFMDAVINGIAW